MNNRVSLSFIVILGLALTQAIPTPEPATKVLEKKSLTPEDTNKTSNSEAPAIEDAEEPIQADRAKKSATTTFCVEIRPGPSEVPVKVCDEPPPPPPEPQIPQVPQEIPEPPPPPPPEHHEPEFVIVPPNPFAVFFPSEAPSYIPEIQHPLHASIINLPIIHQPQIPVVQPPPLQHLIIASGGSNPAPCTCPPSPCATSGGGGSHPQALIALLRSAMSPTENGMNPMDPGMTMRNSDAEVISPGVGSIIAMPSNAGDMPNMPNQITFGPEMTGTPFGRTHGKKLIPASIPAYYQTGTGGIQKSPYIVQCNPQVLSLGPGGSSVFLSSGRDASEGMGAGVEGINGPGQFMMTNPQMGMGSQEPRTHHVIIPSMANTMPGVHFSPTMYQPNYQTHSISPYPYASLSGPSYSTYFRREQQPMPAQRIQQVPAKISNQPMMSPERSTTINIPTQQQPHHSQKMTPSQMLNHMRGFGSEGYRHSEPMMQTFPRENHERHIDPGFRMHIPSGGQTFVINEPRHSAGEKHIGPCADNLLHDEIAKRETAEPAPESEEKA